jgi:hypothetical protein
MGRRVRILSLLGVCLIAIAAIFRFGVVSRISQPDYRSPSSFWTHSARDEGTDTRGIPVIAWYDSSAHKLKDAIRIDIVDGVALAREDRLPVGDILSYVNARTIGTKQNFVVVTVGEGERLGDVVRVVDECRRTRAAEVVVNMNGLESQVH